MWGRGVEHKVPGSPGHGFWDQLRTETDELLYVDFLRFLGCTGVVLFHFERYASAATKAWVGEVVPLQLFVELFFCISGFVICQAYQGRLNNRTDYGRFLRRRVARLAPLHWLTFAFFLAVGALVWSGAMPSSNPQSYDPQCIPAQPAGAARL